MEKSEEYELIALTYVNGYLPVHQFHPVTGQDANAPDANFSPQALKLFNEFLEMGAEFVWLSNDDVHTRARIDQLVRIALEHGMEGVSVCHCNHAAESIPDRAHLH